MEENALLQYRIPGINERQAHIIKIVADKENTVLVSKDLERMLNVSVKTIRHDLEGLVELGFMERIQMNKRLFGYMKSPLFEEKLKGNRGN